MSASILSRAAAAVRPGETTLDTFAAEAGVSAEELSAALAAEGIGRRDGDTVTFSRGDRLRCAICALRAGSRIDEMAELLDWRDFEGLAAEVLAETDYVVTRNLFLKSPRAEIDVVGTKGDMAVLIDCKHWRGSVPLGTVTSRQATRARRYVGSNPGHLAIPVIVTLYQQEAASFGGVPVVPIWQLGSFLGGIHGHLDGMTVITAG